VSCRCSAWCASPASAARARARWCRTCCTRRWRATSASPPKRRAPSTAAGRRAAVDAVFVDQSPIGKTARSNPASYVGAFDELRKIFADAPLARERSYTAGTFSFNAGDGRCPTCGGSGFEHVEMQFLRRLPALPRLRRPPLPPEILDVKVVRGPHAAERGRRAGPHRGRGRALVPERPRGGGAAAAHHRRRPGLRAPGPAGAHAQRRRGAAPEAGRLPGRCGQRPAPGGGQARHAVPLRRADHRPALRRHRQADARAAQAAGRRGIRCWSSSTTWT
jgi:hypothetical protein